MLAIVIKVLPPSIEYSQLLTVPVWPLKVIVPEFDVAQTVPVAGAKVPPTGTGLTVTVEGVVVRIVHNPLLTVALYNVVVTRLVYVCVAVVLTMFVQVTPPLIENCQFEIDPVCPDKVIVPVFTLAQTVAEVGLSEPATVAGVTVIVAVVEVTIAQAPL